jgi:hypothetical protein
MRFTFPSLTAFLLALAGASTATASSRQLPEGPFTLFAGNRTAANFIVENSRTRSGDVVSVINYRVYANAIPSPIGAIAQDTTELVIDCSAWTYQQMSVNAFGPGGDWIISFPTEATKPIGREQTWDFLARAVCNDLRFQPSATVNGANAARSLGLSRLK